MQEIFQKIRLLKALKKLTLSLLMDKVIKKQKGPGTIDQSHFRLQNKSKNISLLVMYYLTKFGDVI